jgi:hypothetical protein
LWLLARYAVGLRGRDWAISVPIGWSVAKTVRARAEALAREIDRALHEADAVSLDGFGVEQETTRHRVSLRRLLVAIAMSAVVLGLVRWPHWTSPEGKVMTNAVAATLVPGVLILFRAGEAATERFMVSLVAMYGPFAWIAAYNRPWGRSSGGWDLALGLPGLVPGMVARISGQNDTLLAATMAASTLAVLAMTAWVAFRGWRSSLVFSIAIGLWSTLTSLGMHVMYRA